MLASFLRDKKEVYAWWNRQQIDYYYFSDLPCSFNLRKPFLRNKCIVQIRLLESNIDIMFMMIHVLFVFGFSQFDLCFTNTIIENDIGHCSTRWPYMISWMPASTWFLTTSLGEANLWQLGLEKAVIEPLDVVYLKEVSWAWYFIIFTNRSM